MIFIALKGISTPAKATSALFCTRSKPRFMRGSSSSEGKTTRNRLARRTIRWGRYAHCPVASLLPSQTSWTFVRRHRQITLRQQDLGIEQCAVQSAFAIIYLITRTQRIKAVTLAGEHFRANARLSALCRKYWFRNVAFKQTKLIIHKADIERCVMDDQLRTADIIRKLIVHRQKPALSSRNSSAIPWRINASGSPAVRLQVNMKIVAGQTTVIA